MSKTIRFKENSLIAIKEKLNEIMVGTDGVSHNDICNENTGEEFAPVTKIGGEEKDGDVVAGGNYFHVAESIDFDNNGMSINDDKILGKYNLKDLILSKTGNYVTLNKIIANELGKGNGSRFMEELTRMADKNGWTLALTPDTSFGGSSVGRLKNFYKRFGFVPNKGRSTDFNTRESMVRKPLNENKYDDLFDIRNTNKKISDCEEAISYFKNVSDEITEKMECISSKYGCKRMFFIASINQGVIQANQNDVNEFCRLGDERREIEEKIKTLKDLIKEIEKEEKREKEAQKYRLEQEENDRIFSLVIDEYGTTNRIENAEYILPDGTMLCSGGDHRGIASVYATNNISIFDDTYRYNYIVDFLNRGAIRCRMFDGGGILDMTREPTDKQYTVINTFVRYASNIDIDFTSNKGETLNSVSYSNVTPQRVTSDIYRYYNEGIIPQGNSQFESKKGKSIIIPENKLDIIKENIESEVESSEVDLSSFKKRDTLPPGIWKDEDTLDSRVRLKLLDIADDFWEFVNLTWVEPKGIIITGSICNFNWSKFSDIDLHLIVDFNEIDEKTEFVKQYLDSKKNEWNTEHEGLKIMGFPVELFVQNINDNVEAGGIYDLEENVWIRRPNPHTIKSIGLNKFNIKDKAAEIMTIIDDMYDKLSTTTDGHEIEEIGDDAHYLWDKVKDMRKKSLSKNGESGSGNIVYKVLRRTGYLDKLFKLFSRVYDRSNSINEGTEKPSEEEYYWAKSNIYDTNSPEDYDYYKDIIDRYEAEDNLYDKLSSLSTKQFLDGQSTNSEYILTNGKTVNLHGHDSVEEVGLKKTELLKMGNIRIIGGTYSNYVYLELAKYPNDIQKRKLLHYISTCYGTVYVDITYDNELRKSFVFERRIFSPELIMKKISDYFGITSENVRKYLTVLKEEVAIDGSSENNPYEKRWKAEREALKSFVANYGKLMQSKEDNKGGKLYKVYFDETMSNLIGYNYCICVQWDELTMKPKSTVYIRALDKFTPFIRRNLQFDTRGRDNMRGTYDDNRFVRESVDELNLYHSSYSNFDKFNHRKYLSSGAGSQTFGWGTYLTDSFPIAESYAGKFIWQKFNEFIVSAEPEDYIGDASQYNDEIVKEACRLYRSIVRTRIVFTYGIERKYSRNFFDCEFEVTGDPAEEYDNMMKKYEEFKQFLKAGLEKQAVKVTPPSDEQMRNAFSVMNSGGDMLDTPRDEYIATTTRRNSVNSLVKLIINNIWDAADNHVKKESYIYEVEIPDDNGYNYLDYSNPVSPETAKLISSGVMKLYRRFGNKINTNRLDNAVEECLNGRMRGENLYEELTSAFGGSEKAVSLFLNQCGIVGIKYRAGTIYELPDGADESSLNYVIFDANNVRITSKNLFTDNF